MNMLYSILDPNLENLYFQPENSLLTLVQGKNLESNRFSIAKNAYVGIAPKAIGQAVPFVPTITGSQCPRIPIKCIFLSEGLKTMEHNTFTVAYLLIYQKALDIRSLVSTQLDNFTRLFIPLHGTIARKVLFESLANSLDVQIIR